MDRPERSRLSQSVQCCCQQAGKNLIWFAEGGRSPSGELHPLREGIGVLLEQCGASVVPVYIEGTVRAMPVGRAFPRPVSVIVIFGTPLTPEELRNQGEGERPQEKIAKGLHAAFATLQEKKKKKRRSPPP